MIYFFNFHPSVIYYTLLFVTYALSISLILLRFTIPFYLCFMHDLFLKFSSFCYLLYPLYVLCSKLGLCNVYNNLQKNDSNWKKSRTHYVMTSYIQPWLLWSGAILICRFFSLFHLSYNSIYHSSCVEN